MELKIDSKKLTKMSKLSYIRRNGRYRKIFVVQRGGFKFMLTVRVIFILRG